jgi:hypothetical protein
MGLHPEPSWRPETKKFWKGYLKAYKFEIDEAEILRTACRAMDRMLQAAELLDLHGLVFFTKTGGIRKNPAADIEKHSRAALLQALKILNVKKPPEEKGKVGRPSPHLGVI